MDGNRPRVIVISLIDEQWRWNDSPHRITDCTEGWAYALKGEFHGGSVPSADKLAEYDLVMANVDPPLVPAFARAIENKRPHQKWAVTIEGCGTDYYTPSREMLAVFDSSDLVCNINERSTDYIRSLTRTRTEWVGIPFPVEEVASHSTPLDQRRDEVLICPRKNYNPSVMAANSLGLPISTYLGKVSRKPRNLPLFWKHRYFGTDLNLKLWNEVPSPVIRTAKPERGLSDTWRDASGCRLWMNLDPRYTWARWVLEAAAMRVPIIATESTCHAQRLFPEMTVRDVFCVSDAISIGKRILDDPEWASVQCERAFAGLSVYRPEACVERLAQGLNMDSRDLL